MRKNTLFIIVGLVLLAIVAASYLKAAQGYVTNYPSKGANIVAFGDSLVEGVGSNEGGFPGIISKDLGVPVINLGHSGDTTADALARADKVAQQNPKVVVVLLGGNDYLNHVPMATSYQNLGAIIENIQKAGATVLLLGIDNKLLNAQERQIFKDLSEQYHTAYIPDIMGSFYGDPAYMSDGLHPNDKGYDMMAKRIEPELEKLLK